MTRALTRAIVWLNTGDHGLTVTALVTVPLLLALLVARLAL